MDSTHVFSLCTLLVSVFLCTNYVHAKKNVIDSPAQPQQNNVFDVAKYGARSDGKSDSSTAFLSAWKAACGAPGGVLSVPSGTYLVNGAKFEGPCKGATFFQNQGIVRAAAGANSEEHWLSFYEVDGLQITGKGVFDGYGSSAWKMNQRPVSIKIYKVNKLVIKGITSLNSKQFHFHIDGCDDVLVDNVYIKAPGNSPNTDGIHLARSTNIKILNTKISTGDDCISIGDGVQNAHVEWVTCGPGHGISIGSLGKYAYEKDVSGITVRNCNLMDTTNGLRIKTFAPSSVPITVSNITFENINLRNVQNPIILDQYYCANGGCSHGKESGIKISDVKYINVKGTSASPVAVNLKCSKSVPCQSLKFQGLGITTGGGKSTAAACSSAKLDFVDPGTQTPRACA